MVDKGTKNVSFNLQADEDVDYNIKMVGTASASSSLSSVGIDPAQDRSLVHLDTALPQRQSRERTRGTGVRQQTEACKPCPQKRKCNVSTRRGT